MASKSNSNSNKTAHVMNLLRKNNVTATEENDETENNVENVQLNKEQQNNTLTNNTQTTQQKPHIIASLNADTEISLNIRDALNDALIEDSEKLEKIKSSELDNIEQFTSVISNSQSSKNNHEKIEIENSIEKDIEVEQIKEVDNDEIDIYQEDGESKINEVEDNQVLENEIVEEPALINMMQLLVEEKIDKYMKMSGVCTCSKCRNDVLALALNKLSAKYVVMKPSEMVLRSDMYKNRYSGEIIAQLLCACDKVKENPTH